MSSFSKNNNNNNNNNNSTIYRSKLFRSAEQQKSNYTSKPVYKTLCKVCQDAGKTEQEYTNHSVRDKSGKTLCPTLLAQECRHCYKNGHTVKYCPLLKAHSEPVKAEIVKPKPVITKPKNVFMVLESDSEEEEEKVSMPMRIAPALPNQVNVFNVSESFPQLVAASANQKPVFSYGKIIQQANDPETYAKAKQAEMKLKAEKYAEECETKRKAEVIAWAKAQANADAERQAREERMNIKITKTRWVDAESSDEEEDDEEPYRVEVVDNSAW